MKQDSRWNPSVQMNQETERIPPSETSRPPYKKDGGFTLIEVMAALAIMGMVLVTAGGLLVSTIEARDTIQMEFERTNQGVALLDLMVKDLSSAVSLHHINGERRYFYAESDGFGDQQQDTLDFVTTRETYDPERNMFADVTEVGYMLEQHSENQNLYQLYRRTSPWPDDDPVRGGTLTEIHDRVVSLNFDFRPRTSMSEQENQETEWVEQWDDVSEERNGALPGLVRIELTLQFEPRDGAEEDDPVERTYETIVSVHGGNPTGNQEEENPEEE